MLIDTYYYFLEIKTKLNLLAFLLLYYDSIWFCSLEIFNSPPEFKIIPQALSNCFFLPTGGSRDSRGCAQHNRMTDTYYFCLTTYESFKKIFLIWAKISKDSYWETCVIFNLTNILSKYINPNEINYLLLLFSHLSLSLDLHDSLMCLNNYVFEIAMIILVDIRV